MQLNPMNDNTAIVEFVNKKIVLIGTAHVSQQSVEEVEQAIDAYEPDAVCIELDTERYKTIQDENKWKNTNIYEIIRQKKGMTLLASIILSAYQRKIGAQLDIAVGAEMLHAIDIAKKKDIPIELIDRNIKTTFARIWRRLRFWEKTKLIFSLVMSLFDDTTISEEDLEELKKHDIIQSALSEMGSAFAGVKEVLVDERDQYMSQKIKQTEGEVIVAIIGAAHMPGILKHIHCDIDTAPLDIVPPKGKVGAVVGWTISLAIIALIALSFRTNVEVGLRQVLSWFLITGTCSALGALVAMGHPLSVLAAFLAAPISTLSPALAAGWFAGLAEAYVRKPVVADFERLYDDVTTLRGFWRNKITKILLVTALANVGSTVGAAIAGLNIIKNLIG